MKFRYAASLICSLLAADVTAFAPSHRGVTISSSSLEMAGMGMGMGSKKKKGGPKKNKKNAGGSSFDVAKSCLKSEKLYDNLMKEAAKALNDDDDNGKMDYITAEYMIAARVAPRSLKDVNVPGVASVSDWVPVSQLCLKRHVDDPGFDSHVRDCERLATAISYYCREINHAASLSASIFKSIPRNAIQYSAEPIDSFHKFVYEDIIEGKNQDEKNENTMSKAESRTVLQIPEGCNDASEIKSAYRKLSFKLHPDRFVGKNRSEEEIKQASEDFAKVKLAYESMSSGVRSTSADGSSSKSWYQSLGGRQRTDFSGAVQLQPLGVATETFKEGGYKAAIAGLNPETVMTFVARNQAASKQV